VISSTPPPPSGQSRREIRESGDTSNAYQAACRAGFDVGIVARGEIVIRARDTSLISPGDRVTSMNRQTPRRSRSRPQIPYSPIQVLKSNTTARIQSNSRICRDQIANGTEIASPTIPNAVITIRIPNTPASHPTNTLDPTTKPCP